MPNWSMPLIISLIAVVGFGCASTDPPTVPLRVMSFNIRFDNPGDGLDAWSARRERVATTIRDSGVDILGVQEAQPHQLAELAAMLPELAWFGVGRNADLSGEHSAIFYRRERFELIDSGTFWLSDTPQVAGSKGWDADYERIVTWGRLRDRLSGRAFHYFNTHFDHVGEISRRESARLLLRKVDEIAGPRGPVILTGDFNATPDSEPVGILTREGGFSDALARSETAPVGPDSTWNAFRAIEPGRRIDFVFVRGAVSVRSHQIVDRTFDGRFPSDHLPVVAELGL
jgi:endonuclease/exonuclease/phosphatase family metal-dependent hydrolase